MANQELDVQGTGSISKPEENSAGSISVGNISDVEAVAIGHGARAEVHRLYPPPPPPQPKFIVPFPRNEHFVGRDDDLQHLHTALQKSDKVGVRPAMLTGMGGIGKTQLAVEYTYRYQGEYPGGVYWVNAAQDWQDELASLAIRIGLREDDVPEYERRLRLVLAFADFLTAHTDALIVFDNVEDPRLLRTPVPGFIPTELKCRLLFTTRRRESDLPFHQLEVRALSEETALELLLHTPARQILLKKLNTTVVNPELDAAHAICRSLGYLPLALTLAAAYLGKHPRISFASYLVRLEKEGGLATVDAAGVDPLDLPTRHDTAVAATLKSQWDVLASEDARHILKVAALLGEAARVPRARLALLTGLAEAVEDGCAAPFDNALLALNELSLVEELTEHEIRLHPLVQKFAESTIPDRSTFAEDCARRLTEALWDVAQLDQQIAQRGVDAISADLRSALALTPDTERSAPISRLTSLLRALDLQAHHLRAWDLDQQPGFFLQQLRNQCFELALDELRMRAEAQLAEKSLPYLRERFRVSRESTALVRVLTGHTDCVTWVTVALDGSLAVSASLDKTLKIWDLNTGQVLRTLTGHTDWVTRVAVTPNGRLAVSASRDGTLKVWDLSTGQALQTFKEYTSYFVDVTSLAVTPDGRLIIAVAEERGLWLNSHTLKVWDLHTGQELYKLTKYTSVSVTPDGRLAVSSRDRTLKVWDLATGQELHTLEGNADWVHSVAVIPDGRQVVFASINDTLKVWDLATGLKLRTFNFDIGQRAAVTPDGRLAISASLAGTLKVWDLNTGQKLRTFEGHGPIRGVAVTPDGRQAISASEDHTLKVWNLRSDHELHMPKGHSNRVCGVAVTPDGSLAVSASDDNTLKVWDLSTGQELRTLEGHYSWVRGVAVTPDARLLVSGAWNGTLKVWDLRTGRELRTLKGHDSEVYSVALTPDGRLVVSASGDKTVRVWDLNTGQELHVLKGHTSSVHSVAVTMDGRLAISASVDRTLKVWDLNTGQELHTLEGHASAVHGVAVTPDGRLVVSGSHNGVLKVWNLNTGKAIHTFTVHAMSANWVAVTPHGDQVISVSNDRTLKVWDLGTGQVLLTLSTDAQMRCCAVAPDGRTILAGDERGSIHFIDWARFDDQ
jgi:WD40 repeat protein